MKREGMGKPKGPRVKTKKAVGKPTKDICKARNRHPRRQELG